MEAFIKFFFTHINIIIYVLGLITVLLIGVMTFLNLGADDNSSCGGVDNKKITDLENLLKKMLESAQTRVVPAAGVVDTEEKPKDATQAPQQVVVKEVDTAALNEAKAEVQTLKSAVGEKEAIIAKLKSSLELAQQEQTKKAAPGQQMQEKLRELEAKLAEYEIIEDDIADLTMYKEENAQLKEQIKQLMKGQSTPVDVPPPTPAPAVAEAPAPAPVAEALAPIAAEPAAVEVPATSTSPVIEEEAAPAVAEAPAPAAATPPDAVSDDLLEQFKQALTETAPASEQKSTPVVSTTQPPSPQVEAAVNDDLMSEFESALSAQRKSDSAPAQVQGPIPSFPIDGESGAETHDIMAEFVTDTLTDDGTNVHMPLDSSTTITAANDPLATTDPNKMISEVESLTAQGTDADGNALEGETDTDKMLKEMEDFKKLASGE